MDVIIDFSGYFIPDNKFTIKEFSVMSLLRGGFSTTPSYVSGVFKSPFNWNELPEHYKISYFIESQDFGIAWDQGNLDYDIHLAQLKKLLENATHIYVKDPKIKYLLETQFRHLYSGCEISPLYNFGYIHEFVSKTECVYHENPSHHVCTLDNVKQMTSWFIRSDTANKLPCCVKRKYSEKDLLNSNKHLKVDN